MNSTSIPMDSAQEFLLAHFRSCAMASQFSPEAIGRLLHSDWSILVTDAQHHPLVRQLIDGALQIGKPVAVFPEGAISYVGFQERFGGTSLFIADPRIMRFVLDAAQRDYWLRLGVPFSKIQVSGYLGDGSPTTVRGRRLAGALLTVATSQLKVERRALTVLLTLDSFTGSEQIGRFGMPFNSQMLHHLTLILDDLIARGYRVFAKTRDAELTSYLESHYQGSSAFFTTHVPWEVLGERADLVLTRDSSIGWEALARGIPVLVWNFSDYPSFMDVTLKGIPDYWVGVARAISELDVEIQGLLTRHREAKLAGVTDGLLAPPVQSRSEMVKEWIEGDPYF